MTVTIQGAVVGSGVWINPSIVTNGLIMYYDQNNTLESFKGKPVTNMFDYRNDFSGWTKASSSIIAADAISPDGTMNATRLTSTTAMTGMYRVNCAFTNSTTYTTSIYAKAGSTALMYGGFSNQFEGAAWYYYWDLSTRTVTNGSQSGFTSGSYTITQLLNGWLRFTVTATTEASGTSTSIGAYWRVNAAAAYVWVYGAQTELGAYATPFADPTRSVTQSMYDITGTTTSDVTYLSWDGTGLPTFNGSSSYIIFPNSTALDNQTITIESWFKPTVTEQLGFLFEKGTVNTQYSFFLNTGNASYFRTIGLTPQDLAVTTTNYITAGVYNQVVCTYAAGTKTTYFNGVLGPQQTGVTGTIATSAAGMSVGVYGGYNGARSYWFNGSIPVTRIYNRALTGAEVLQNFYASRAVYGI